MKPFSILPNTIAHLEKLSIKLAGEKYHYPAFWLGTLCMGPLGLYLWRTKPSAKWQRGVAAVLSQCTLLLALILFFSTENSNPVKQWARLASCVILILAARWLWSRPFKNRFLTILLRAFLFYAMLEACGKFLDSSDGPQSLWLLAACVGRIINWCVRLNQGFIAKRTGPREGSPSGEPQTEEGEMSFAGASIPGRFGFTRLDRTSLGLIGFFFICFAIGHKHLLNEFAVADSWYHMAVARQIIEQGKIPRWATWQYQYAELDPDEARDALPGRPHLYPPAFHVLNALLAFGNIQRIPAAYNFLQVIMYPLAMLTSWYLMRWLQDDVVAFLGLVVLSMDTLFNFSLWMLIPSGFVMAVFPIWMLTFIRRRLVPAILMTAFCFYMHPGIPPVIMIGFAIFAITNRGYLPFFWRMAAGGIALYVPWLAHMVRYHSWLHTPGENFFQGLLLLQCFHPIFILLGIRGWRKKSDFSHRPIKVFLISFLPLLIFYGGRYWMHTAQFWAMLIALNFKRFLEHHQTRKRIALFLALTLAPLPIIPLQFELPIAITGSHISLLSLAGRDRRPVFEKQGFDQLAALIQRHTDVDEIVHVQESREGIYLADKIVLYTGRRVDTGGWKPEVRTREMERKIETWRMNNPDCLFVYFKRKHKDMPHVRLKLAVGDFCVGVRGKAYQDFSRYKNMK